MLLQGYHFICLFYATRPGRDCELEHGSSIEPELVVGSRTKHSDVILGMQAANIATAFRRLGSLHAERRLPAAVLRGAAGFAIISMAKVSRCCSHLSCPDKCGLHRCSDEVLQTTGHANNSETTIVLLKLTVVGRRLVRSTATYGRQAKQKALSLCTSFMTSLETAQCL